MSVTAEPTAPAGRQLLTRMGMLTAALVLLIVLCGASVVLGVRAVSLADVVNAWAGHTDTLGEAAVVARLPRTVLALLAGAALAMAGTAMQAVTRNPLADPAILGVSGGASLAVVCGIAFFGLYGLYPIMTVAVIGAAGTAVLVYAIGSLGSGGATPLKLTLSGAATSAASISLVGAVMLPRVDVMESFRFWQIGGVGGATWDRVAVVTPMVIAGAVLCLVTVRGMNSLALGDELAAGLGVRVTRTRVVAAAGAVILCGVITAVAGPIGFVGLIVPHLCRLVFGPDYRWLLPASAVVGACLLIAADIVGRLVARPAEIDVGIVTAIIGAPLFIWIVRRQKVREL